MSSGKNRCALPVSYFSRYPSNRYISTVFTLYALRVDTPKSCSIMGSARRSAYSRACLLELQGGHEKALSP